MQFASSREEANKEKSMWKHGKKFLSLSSLISFPEE
jgi:hypothetical protein